MLFDEYYDYSYTKGQVILEKIGCPDSYVFDLYDTGAYLFITLSNPTSEEIASVSGHGEIRMTCFPRIMFFTFKFGDLDWGDAPYTPHLSIQASDLRKTLFESCSHVTIVVCNSVNGEIVFSGTVKFNDELSAAMRAAITLILLEDFNRDKHDYLYRVIQSKYTSKQIADMAVASCKYERVVVPRTRF